MADSNIRNNMEEILSTYINKSESYINPMRDLHKSFDFLTEQNSMNDDMFKNLEKQEESILKIQEQAIQHQKEMYEWTVKNNTYENNARMSHNKNVLEDLKKQYDYKFNNNQKYYDEINNKEAEIYKQGLNNANGLTQKQLMQLQRLHDQREALEEESFKSKMSKMFSIKKIGTTIIKDIVKDAEKVFDLFFTNNIDSAINGLKTKYESEFTKIAGRMGLQDRNATHNVIADVSSTVANDPALSKGLNFNNEVFPEITAAVEKGFLGEKAKDVAITNAVDKKIMPWLDTASETWVNLQYNLSDDSLRQIKGQQLLLQATQEGNRILQNGVVSEITNSLAPTLLNIDANTTDVSTMTGQAQAMASALMDQGYSKQDAIKAVNQVINAYQNPMQALQSNHTADKLYALGGLQGGDIASALTFANNFLQTGVNGNWATSGAFANLGFVTNGLTRNTDWMKDMNVATQAANDYVSTNLQGTYNNKANNLSEYVTATQESDNKIQNSITNALMGVNLIAHGMDGIEIIQDHLKQIKGMLFGIIAEGLLSGFNNSLKPGGFNHGSLFTSTASAGSSGLTSAMSIPAVGLAGGAIGAGLATYGFSEMSNYKKENQTGLAISSGVGGGLGAAGGAMLAGGAIAGMAGVGVANAWNPVGWGLLIASGLALAGTEIYNAATTIGGSARQIEAEYQAEKDRINKQFRDQKDVLQTIHTNLKNSDDLETQRSSLIESGILSEHDVEIARKAEKEGLEKLINAYLIAADKISPEIENDLDKYERSDMAMAEDIQKNFRKVANEYLDSGKLTEGSNELDAIDTMLFTIYKDLDTNSDKQDSWTKDTKKLYKNLTKAYKDSKLSVKEVNNIIDEGWRNQSFVEANISASALNTGYEKIMANNTTSSFGNKMRIKGTFYGTERATEAVTLANQALLQTSKEGAKEYLDKAKAKGYTSSEFSEIGDAAYKWELTGYKLGSTFIPQDMIAQLHRGERVLTETQNKEYTEELTIGGSKTNIIQASIQDVVTAIHTQTQEIINYLSMMSFNSNGNSSANTFPTMGNTKVTF